MGRYVFVVVASNFVRAQRLALTPNLRKRQKCFASADKMEGAQYPWAHSWPRPPILGTRSKKKGTLSNPKFWRWTWCEEGSNTWRHTRFVCTLATSSCIWINKICCNPRQQSHNECEARLSTEGHDLHIHAVCVWPCAFVATYRQQKACSSSWRRCNRSFGIFPIARSS